MNGKISMGNKFILTANICPACSDKILASYWLQDWEDFVSIVHLILLLLTAKQ
jgi:hypothetical protein